jgi:thiamine biosynthesis lipoprotein
MKKLQGIYPLLTGLILILLIEACSGPTATQRYEIMGQAQGTYYRVMYYHPDRVVLMHHMDSILDTFNYTASTYQENSIISRVNANVSTELNNDFVEIFKQAMMISEETDGAFDITVMPLVKTWGFHFEDRQKLAKTQVDSVLEFIGYDMIDYRNDSIIKKDPRTTLDYNSIAQGYSVDILAAYLDSKGIESYLVDVGGEMKSKGIKDTGDKWRVGIQKPEDSKVITNKLQAIIELHDKSMATSGNYRKFFIEDGVKYSHTIDPKTGYPVQHSLLSATVITDECSMADAYATAFMVMGLEKAKAFAKAKEGLEAYFIYSAPDGSFKVSYTDGFEDLLVEE